MIFLWKLRLTGFRNHCSCIINRISRRLNTILNRIHKSGLNQRDYILTRIRYKSDRILNKMRLELRKLDKRQMKIAQNNLNRSVRFLSSYAGLIVLNAANGYWRNFSVSKCYKKKIVVIPTLPPISKMHHKLTLTTLEMCGSKSRYRKSAVYLIHSFHFFCHFILSFL